MKTVTGGKTQTEWGKATICVISEPFFLVAESILKTMCRISSNSLYVRQNEWQSYKKCFCYKSISLTIKSFVNLLHQDYDSSV